ncbi:DUF1648 domain-containing protein [Longimicrobium sp.]|jgi:uncharacterized membrane protein|uniref:DUF1648 domain-containing protein n=1 Tax=Longimicrobium sp. TaxID=2029185 RepID=UPI002EDAAE26
MTEKPLRLATLGLLAALYAGSAAAYPRLPERIPIHFDLAGNPDGWASTSLLSWFLLPLIATAMAGFLFVIGRVSEYRPELWNVPEKPRFLALPAEARAPIVARLRAFLALMAVMTTALMGVIQVEVFLTATGRGPAPPWLMTGAIVLMLVATGVTGVRMGGRVAVEIREAHQRLHG